MDQVYPILVTCCIALCVSSFFRGVFSLGISQLMYAWGWSIGIVILILTLGSFSFPVLIAVTGCFLLGTLWLRIGYRLSLSLLIGLLSVSTGLHLIPEISTFLGVILATTTSVFIEESLKTSGLLTTPPDTFPYDGLIVAILLGSFFGIIEAGRAGRIGSTQDIWMRLVSSLSIHTAVTMTLLGASIVYSRQRIMGGSIGLLAILLHLGYNLFQGHLLIVVLLLLLSYGLITYWTSKIDRLYI